MDGPSRAEQHLSFHDRAKLQLTGQMFPESFLDRSRSAVKELNACIRVRQIHRDVLIDPLPLFEYVVPRQTLGVPHHPLVPERAEVFLEVTHGPAVDRLRVSDFPGSAENCGLRRR